MNKEEAYKERGKNFRTILVEIEKRKKSQRENSKRRSEQGRRKPRNYVNLKSSKEYIAS